MADVPVVSSDVSRFAGLDGKPVLGASHRVRRGARPAAPCTDLCTQCASALLLLAAIAAGHQNSVISEREPRGLV
jgi:hypothetical protein